MLSLTVEGLEKSFGGPPLFRDLSFARSAGLLGVSGRNGSGKSTLLKILAGVLRPTRGLIAVLEDGRKLPPSELRRAVGWASPEIEFPGELTAAENLGFLARSAGAPLPRSKIAQLLQGVGLGPSADRRVEEFSSGMKQRLRLAFSLLTDPGVLLWDEPFANLDSEGIADASRLLDRRRKRGPVVVATNDRRELASPDAEIALS